MYSKSFFPIVGDHPKILILGTLPGKESIRLNQYYANSRNIFWSIIYKLFNESIEAEYSDRIGFLKKNNIAIWDICYKGIRKNSLDSNITDEIPNELDHFIMKYPTLKLIIFNGQKADKLYDKYFDRFDGIDYDTFLSTSPANTTYTFDEKFNNWKIILDYLK